MAGAGSGGRVTGRNNDNNLWTWISIQRGTKKCSLSPNNVEHRHVTVPSRKENIEHCKVPVLNSVVG